MEKPLPKAAIFGCSGLTLGDVERSFFQEQNPLGFILFARNCETSEQIIRLVQDLRRSVGRHDAPVLIDQEGGRVQRLKPPICPEYPPQGAFAKLASSNADVAIWAAMENASSIAADLMSLGVDVDCLPLLDVNTPDGHDVIGDRAFGDDPELIAALADAVMSGLMSQGVMPIVKHIPGHGRARVDSHLELPIVETKLDILQKTDFRPFKLLADAPWAMTAHVVYTDIDPVLPATLSPRIISEIIRSKIGFDGLLLTDDMSMKALQGPIGENAVHAIEAGCDVVLHCNGKMEEMEDIAAHVGAMSDQSWERFTAARRQLDKVKRSMPPQNMEEVRRRLSPFWP